MDAWFVYLLECSDGTYYCGVTNDVKRRISAHNKGNGAKYTRARLPVKLMAKSGPLTKSEAHKAEAYVKSLPRPQKRAAVKRL